MGWGLSHCLFWENCIGSAEKWNLLFPGTEQHLSYWSEKVWGEEDFLCSPVFSVSVWSISSPAWWANDFSTLMLQVSEIIANYLVELRVTALSVFPCHQVFLISVGDCNQFSTPFASGNQSAVASTFTILSQQPLYPFRFPTAATLTWKDHDSLENILKDCQVVEHPPLQCLCVKEGFASRLSGMTKTTKAQPNGLLGSSQSF